MTENDRTAPDWEMLYQNQDVETLPWFTPALDHDFDIALKQLKIKSGSALDLGTGPGTQAIALAQRGFNVTATDIAKAAIQKAKIRAKEKGFAIHFRQDDVLKTKLKNQFDIIFDRGIFHIFPPEKREYYVRNVSKLLKNGGWLFLKCFSDRELGEEGPYRLSPEEIRRCFDAALKVRSIKRTFFKSVRQPNPHALFCVIQKQGA